MLQLVCEIFLALAVVFLGYLAFRNIFIKCEATISPEEDKNKDLDRNSESD